MSCGALVAVSCFASESAGLGRILDMLRATSADVGPARKASELVVFWRMMRASARASGHQHEHQ
eukprot:11644201-Alexandrium_andersonii.AAC.1